MKYKENFLRDFSWYIKWRNHFIFSGSALNVEKDIKHDIKGISGKEAFFKYDSTGKLHPTRHPQMLFKLLKTKASINFQIKQWAEDRGKGRLGMLDFKDIIAEYDLLSWMVDAVEKQKLQYYEKDWGL